MVTAGVCSPGPMAILTLDHWNFFGNIGLSLELSDISDLTIWDRSLLRMRRMGSLKFVVTLVVISILITSMGCSDNGPDITSGDGNQENAIREFGKAIHQHPNDAPAYVQQAYSYAELGEYTAALADCTKAIQLDSVLRHHDFRHEKSL